MLRSSCPNVQLAPATSMKPSATHSRYRQRLSLLRRFLLSTAAWVAGRCVPAAARLAAERLSRSARVIVWRRVAAAGEAAGLEPLDALPGRRVDLRLHRCAVGRVGGGVCAGTDSGRRCHRARAASSWWRCSSGSRMPSRSRSKRPRAGRSMAAAAHAGRTGDRAAGRSRSGGRNPHAKRAQSPERSRSERSPGRSVRCVCVIVPDPDAPRSPGRARYASSQPRGLAAASVRWLVGPRRRSASRGHAPY